MTDKIKATEKCVEKIFEETRELEEVEGSFDTRTEKHMFMACQSGRGECCKDWEDQG